MSDDLFGEKLIELTRKRDMEKIKFLENLDKKILKSQLERIQKNDKKVLEELFLPKWLEWDLLKSWASRHDKSSTIKCIICEKSAGSGNKVRGKTICSECVIEIRNL